MRYGFVVPFADSREFADLAVLGEQRGWDGIFTWEALYAVDAWVSLAAAAMLTQRIKLGTLVTPVPRVKPWDLATHVGTVDRLSHGRVILGAGLGALHDGWTAYEPDEGRKTRAEKLDEGLAVYAGLLGGQPFEFEGKHYQAKPNDFMQPPPPAQRPHPPVWVVGAKVIGKTRQPSLARAARWQGLLPVWADPAEPHEGESGVHGPDRIASIVEDVKRLREEAGLPWKGYDVILEADSTGEFVKTEPHPPEVWAEVGVTWWIESWWSLEPGEAGRAELLRRIEAGPLGL
jgi:alkanesulfonate monooxygenase SsuD/methylene tetrahydromethanopterin reductase-like flavin-dependent oxidoreductase (luciferase family)